MIIGTTLIGEEATSTTYSPSFPRQGNAATFVLDVIATWICQVTVTIQTKNSEDPDPGTSASGGTIVRSAVGRGDNRNYNLEELVRYKFDVVATNPQTGSGFIHFRMLDPAWETN